MTAKTERERQTDREKAFCSSILFFLIPSMDLLISFWVFITAFVLLARLLASLSPFGQQNQSQNLRCKCSAL